MKDKKKETKKNKVIALVKIPEYAELENEIEIITSIGWEGNKFGQLIGRTYADGKRVSYFTKDGDGTETFDRLEKDIELIKIPRTVLNKETDELLSVVNYYIPFEIKDHCSKISTVTSDFVDNCCNVKTDVTFEVLFAAGDNFTRYVTFDYSTKGTFSSSFFNQIEMIGELLEEKFDKKDNGFIKKKDYKTVTFYNNVGENLDIEIGSINELLDMISSLRVIKLEKTIINDEKRFN